MKAYLVTTGVLFAAIVAAHVARVVAEGLQLAKDPVFLALTALAAGMSLWAWTLLARSGQPVTGREKRSAP